MGGVCADGGDLPCVNGPQFLLNLRSNPHVETDIMYFNMFGTGLVVLNSSETITDLLDKRSAIYSDKVTVVHVSRLFGQVLIRLDILPPR